MKRAQIRLVKNLPEVRNRRGGKPSAIRTKRIWEITQTRLRINTYALRTELAEDTSFQM